MEIRAFQPADEEAVIALWRECGLVKPQNNPHKDIRRKLAVNPEMFLVGCEGGQVVASVMVGYEGHRGWINYLAVSAKFRRQGLGRQLMDEAEKMLRQRKCPKISLQVRASNREVVEFYKRLGFAPDDVVSLGKRLEPD
ncbi:MAG TPA: GNAT family acetyltransferase [Opitutales bacterium]|nr:GNAT family acetyltransferase [Opitutales bacterium]